MTAPVSTLLEKVRYSKELIRCWYEAWDGKVYVSFSGGRDSTVLLHLVRTMFPDVHGVFCNTGLEYPEIVSFVKATPNVITVRPKIPFHKVVEKYGWPVVSKEQSQFISELRTTKSASLRVTRTGGNRWGKGKVSEKWKFLVGAPFKVSHLCCKKLKKDPMNLFCKESGMPPMMGNMAEESSLRATTAARYSCNAYECKRPTSKPLTYWTQEDVKEYIRITGIPYSSIYDKGYSRTGCMFCLYGVHLNNPNKIQVLSQTHPKQWDFIINKMGAGAVLDYIGVPSEIKRNPSNKNKLTTSSGVDKLVTNKEIAMTITVEQVIEKYIETRDAIEAEKKLFDAKVADLKALQENREKWLMGALDKVGATSMKAPHGTVFIDWKDSAVVADAGTFLAWVYEDWDERNTFLENRVSKTAVKQRLEDGQTPPPGVNYTKVKDVKVRRA